jgi:hypothetical protein
MGDERSVFLGGAAAQAQARLFQFSEVLLINWYQQSKHASSSLSENRTSDR